MELLDRLTKGARPWALLCALCALLWLPGFFTLPPSDRDESRFAQASKQMIETGDYVRIRNGLVARNQKPIGIYWLQLPFARAARAAGLAAANPVWPYRVPSLLGALASVLMVYGFGRALVGPSAALLGAVFLASSLLLTVEAHMAKTDAALLAATTASMFLLGRAWLDPRGLGRANALGFWAAMGGAILIKGPVAPMVAALCALWLALCGRRAGAPRWLLALRPRTGPVLLLAMVLPWFVAIGIATHGRFFAQSVGGDLAGKLAGGDDAHGAPFGLHAALLPLLMFAGGIPAFAGIAGLWASRRDRVAQFLAGWIIPSWLVFEIVATKLPHYTLPLYPPIALLAGQWMLRPAGVPRSWARAGCVLAMALSGLVGVAALALPVVAEGRLSSLTLLGLPGLAVCAVLVAVLALRCWPDPRRTALAMLAATPALFICLLGIELPYLRPLWIAPQIVRALRAHWPDGRPADGGFGELGFAEPSLMFLAGTDTALFATPAAAAAFLAAGPNHVLVVDDGRMPALQAALPRPATAFAHVDGYNYSRGRHVRLSLVSLAPP